MVKRALTRSRRRHGAGVTVVAAALAGCAALALAWLGQGQALSLLIVALLLVGLPLNGWAVRRALAREGLDLSQASRPLIYANTALLWAVIAALGLAAASSTAGWVTPAWIAWPSGPAAWGGVAAGVAIPALAALWTADIATNRRKRARLRLLYRGGLRTLAPQTPGELAAFRAATVVSSFGEEVAYRLVLLSTLAAWLGPWGAAAASSLAFALGHVYQGMQAAALTGLFGLLAAGLTLATGSLWPAIVLHVLWNQAAAGALFAVYRPARRG